MYNYSCVGVRKFFFMFKIKRVFDDYNFFNYKGELVIIIEFFV